MTRSAWSLSMLVVLWVFSTNSAVVRAATTVTQHGITWTFDKDYPTGQFVTGDYWVVGPVTVVGISTDLHAPGFHPGPDDDGSMVNPGADGLQGYDGSLKSYREELNAARPNGRPLSPDNPLVLPPHSSLVSMVSWLYTSENMPNYGREMGKILADVGLVVHLDRSKLPDAPKKEAPVIPLVQFGIDSTGIADAGGGWPENGGHGLGRKFPILFAGALLGDEHMQNVGEWKTRFQDDEQTFYVTQESVDIAHSDRWAPDSRAKDKAPYETRDIGTPEWGVRHTLKPVHDNRGWHTPYRAINGTAIPGFALAVSILGRCEAWNHDAYFDYAVRYMQTIRKHGERVRGTNSPTLFVQNMWDEYHEQFGLVWQPATASATGR